MATGRHGFITTDGTTWTREGCTVYVQRTDARDRGHDDARPYVLAYRTDGEPTGELDTYERCRTLRNALRLARERGER